MKKIINNKLYDTENCELIIDFLTPVVYENILGIKYYVHHHATIYKTKKETYLKYVGEPKELLSCPKKETLEIITKEELKKLLLQLNDVNTYIEEFGEVEEG